MHEAFVASEHLRSRFLLAHSFHSTFIVDSSSSLSFCPTHSSVKACASLGSARMRKRSKDGIKEK